MVWGQSSVNRSITRSPLLVSSITAISTNRVEVLKAYDLSVHVRVDRELGNRWPINYESNTCIRSTCTHQETLQRERDNDGTA